ncbi:MAG: hypothetical protein ABUT20_35505 [Bacteroidota bacterium]
MKKIMIIMLSLGLAVGASAQRFSHGGVYYSRPRVIVTGGFYAPFYPFYSPFYYPYPGYYGYGYRPTKLDMQIHDIKADYADRIYSVKQDKSLTRKERRQKIHDLRVQRDNEIDNAKRNYYKTY